MNEWLFPSSRDDLDEIEQLHAEVARLRAAIEEAIRLLGHSRTHDDLDAMRILYDALDERKGE